MSKATSGKNKNQTAAERARMREAMATRVTRHRCVSVECVNPEAPILFGELFPVKIVGRGMRFYHKDCASREKII